MLKSVKKTWFTVELIDELTDCILGGKTRLFISLVTQSLINTTTTTTTTLTVHRELDKIIFLSIGTHEPLSEHFCAVPRWRK